MFIRNEKRFNPYAPFTDEKGVQYANLTSPELQTVYKITEIADPIPPEDYSDKLYYRTEQDDAPYVIYTSKPQEMIDAAAFAQATQDRAAAYSNEADPLFFKEQRGEVEKGTWLNKIKEIKERYPKPEVKNEVVSISADLGNS